MRAILSTFREDKLSSTGSKHFFSIDGTLILHSVLILEFVSRLIVDFFQVSLGYHELSVLKVVISFVNVNESNYDRDDCDNQNFN